MQAAKQTQSTPESVNSGEFKKILVDEKLDSIKVSRNSRGFTWEIKRYYDFQTKTSDEVLRELEQINQKLQQKYGDVE